MQASTEVRLRGHLYASCIRDPGTELLLYDIYKDLYLSIYLVSIYQVYIYSSTINI